MKAAVAARDTLLHPLQVLDEEMAALLASKEIPLGSSSASAAPRFQKAEITVRTHGSTACRIIGCTEKEGETM